MMRSRIDWLAYAVLISALAACGSSKSTDEGGSSDAGAKGDESSTSSGSAGKSSSTSGSNTTGSNTSSSTKSDAGTADTSSKSDGGTSTKSDGGSSSDKGSSDKGSNGGSGGSAANSGSSNGSTSSSNLPSDGNQLSLCSMAQGDCNKGLACSATTNALSTSRGYCSKICEKDDDCSGVAPSGSKYTCSTGTGTKVCEIECTGTDDTSCPKDMACVQTGVMARANGGAGGGGAAEPRAGAGGAGGRPSPFVAVYHCKYPLATSPLWGPCQDGEHQCDKDATCYGTGAGRAGVCTKSCTMDSDCSDKPSSGSITPSCATITPARGMMMETKLCVLSCLDKKDGCPDGTTCVDGPRAPATTTMGMGNGRGPGAGRGPGMGNAGAGGNSSTSEPSYARCE